MTTPIEKSYRAQQIWLLSVAVLVFAMVIVGGITRLTGSGLSMVEWRPFLGLLPPLSQEEWQRIFGLYQQSPEFLQINQGMTLEEFKAIFFWEYIHRVLGRIIGIVFIIPFLWFLFQKRLPEGYALRLWVLLMLGATQGIVGWWMVKSGLVDNPEVSQYRLAIHLGLALVIFAILLWTYFDLSEGRAGLPSFYSIIVAVLLGITILAGAFVAGLDGGLVYNQYPLMGDGLLPIEYGEAGAWDAFENPASAQFHHRWLAFLVVLGVLGLWREARQSALKKRWRIMLLVVIVQFGLGLLTLLYYVPLSLGVLHQGGAMLLLTATIWYLHGERKH